MQRRIAVVIADLGGGGAQRVLHGLVLDWLKSDIEVTVITISGNDKDVYLFPLKVKRIALDLALPSTSLLSAISKNIKRVMGLRRAIIASQAPVVLSFIGATNILVVFASLLLGKRVVVSERNDPASQPIDIVWKLLRWVTYPLANKVVTNNRKSMSYLIKFVGSQNLIYIPNNGSVQFADEVFIKKKPKKIVLAVGRLHPQKAFDVAVDAFSQSSLPEKDWRLVILGEGNQRTLLEEQARRLKLANHILLPGFKPDIAPWYKDAACLLVTSKYEGTPNVVLEAAYCGVPVIVSGQAGDAPLIIDKLGFGITVETGSAEDFASALDRFVQSERNQFAAYTHVKKILSEEFNDDAIFAKWNEILFIPNTLALKAHRRG